jgi:hypothetical protein
MTVKLPVQIITGAFAVQFAQYTAVATYSLQVYEWLICFSDEYLYVHKARWTSIKVAYLICRYFPLLVFPVYLWAWVGNHSTSVCAKVVQPLYILLVFPTMAAQVVLIIRTYAFAGHNKLILVLLSSLWCAMLGAQLWKQITRWTVVVEWQDLIGDFPCFAWDRRTTASGVGVYSRHIHAMFKLYTFLFDSLMMGIVFIHCLRYRAIWGPLAKVFVAQGLIAYVMMSALHLATTIILFNPNSRLYDGICFLPPVLGCVIACRLILMLRRRTDPNTTTQAHEHSKAIKDAIGQLELAALTDPTTDDSESDPQPIERWD